MKFWRLHKTYCTFIEHLCTSFQAKFNFIRVAVAAGELIFYVKWLLRKRYCKTWLKPIWIRVPTSCTQLQWRLNQTQYYIILMSSLLSWPNYLRAPRIVGFKLNWNQLHIILSSFPHSFSVIANFDFSLHCLIFLLYYNPL